MQRINDLSGHAQLLTDFDQTSQSSKHPRFKLELRWLTREGFADLVKKVWARQQRGNTPIQRWNSRIHECDDSYMDGLSISSICKTEASMLSSMIDKLDDIMEVHPLSYLEIEKKKPIKRVDSPSLA